MTMGIYCIKHIDSGKVYIGQSVHIERRFREHIISHGKKTYIKSAIDKYGHESFDFFIIEEVDDVDKLDDREEWWIAKLKSYKSEYGYNISLRAMSTRGVKFSQEHKDKISAAHMGKIRGPHSEETKAKISSSNKGKQLSEETKNKLRIINSGKVRPDEVRAKISRGNTGRTVSDETKAKISAANTGRLKGKPRGPMPDIVKEKIGRANKGKSHTVSEETKLKMNKDRIGKQLSEETKNKISIAHKGKVLSFKHKAKLSDSLKEYYRKKKSI